MAMTDFVVREAIVPALTATTPVLFELPNAGDNGFTTSDMIIPESLFLRGKAGFPRGKAVCSCQRCPVAEWTACA